MSALHDTLLAWIEQHVEAAIIAALAGSSSPDIYTARLSNLESRVTEIMVSITDIQGLLATETNDIQKLIGFVQAQLTTNATLRAQLENANAADDPAAISQVSAGIQANITTLETALAALSAANPTADNTPRPPRPDPQADTGAVVPPSAPVIS